MHSPEENNEDTIAAPEKLVSALKREAGHVPFIPKAIDEAVLREARRQLRPEPVRKRSANWLVRWVGAGIGVLLLAVVVLQVQWHRSGSQLSGAGAFTREDINHDGRIDILDAFALARQLKAAGPTPLILDVNGDGVVDERDVTAIAARAVRLPGKGGQS